MLRRVPYNLNAMSHDAAMEMIWAVLDAGMKIDTWYVALSMHRVLMHHFLLIVCHNLPLHEISATLIP